MTQSIRRRFLLTASAWMVCLPALAADDAGSVVGLAFTGRLVANLDQSVAFYEALGFVRDPLTADSPWRRDEVIEQLYGVHGIETRMAKMSINSNVSGGRFVVYLREVRGLTRNNLAVHAAWEPGATHFGLVVPDAHMLWASLQEAGMLRARSWGEELVAPPGTRGQLAYVTDPDGLDIEIIDQSPAVPASDGNPGRPARPPGVSHVGLVVSDSDKARAFYGELLGGAWQATEAPWRQGDFFDSAVGGHGNILRFFNLAFTEAYAPDTRLNLELVEFQNRKKPLLEREITDIGVAYFGFEVRNLEAFIERAVAAGATPVADTGIVTMQSGTREIMLRDPDTRAFVLFYEQPR